MKKFLENIKKIQDFGFETITEVKIWGHFQA